MSNRTISTSVIDDVSLKLSNAHAIADLMMECDPGQLCENTLAGAAFVLMELLDETRELIAGKTEAQP